MWRRPTSLMRAYVWLVMVSTIHNYDPLWRRQTYVCDHVTLMRASQTGT